MPSNEHPHESLVSEVIEEKGATPEGVADEALHKLPGFKRTEITKEMLAEEAKRQLGAQGG